jgi:hypothetical protein
MTRAWLLNFDADEELARPDGPRRMPSSRAIEARLVRARVLLVPRGDCLASASVHADRVLCWMPTRRALAAIERLGLPVPQAPSFDIVRRVNSRKFSADLGSGPRGARWIGHLEELERALREPGDWLLRTAHGFAGRGRWPTTSPTEEATRNFARAAFTRDGGLELAPRVLVHAEFALHGFIARGGAITIGVPTVSHVDPQGQWQRVSCVRSELSSVESNALESAAHETALALQSAGYFGPFGIDAFRYGEHRVFCARSEINARYTMAWGRGMRGRRVDLA